MANTPLDTPWARRSTSWFMVISTLMSVGCGPIHIVTPKELMKTASSLPVKVEQRSFSSGERGTSVSIHFGAFKTDSTDAKGREETTPLAESTDKLKLKSVDTMYRYRFAAQPTEAHPSWSTTCIFTESKITYRKKFDKDSYIGGERDASSLLKCEAQSGSAKVGGFSMTHGSEPSEVKLSFTYGDKTYEARSIHHVRNWSFRSPTPKGFNISHQDKVIASIQTESPLRFYAKPDLTKSAEEAIVMFIGGVVYRDYLFIKNNAMK